MRTIKTIICLFIVFLFSGCYIIPCGWDSDLQTIKGQASTNDLIGIYKLDERSKQVISGYEKIDNSEINLQENGRLIYKNILIGTFNSERFYNNDNKLVKGTGKWSLDKNDAKEELFVALDSSESFNGYSTSFRLYKKKDKYVIFIIVGDPDECLAARFIKQ